jgi:hypothetical protein
MGRPYIYQPLESPDQFRLVELLPGTEDEPLHVELHTYHLNEAPPFDSLSYRQESDGPRDIVICGEYEFLVKPDLYHIIQSLRCGRASRWLWIKDISVNMSDFLEGFNSNESIVHRAAVRNLVCITHTNIQFLKDFIKDTQQLDLYRRAESHLSHAKSIFRSTLKITHQDLQKFESVAQTQRSFDTSGVDELLKRKIFDRYGQTSYIRNKNSW